MDELKKRQMTFDIDQNKQKINYLQKKTKNLPTHEEINAQIGEQLTPINEGLQNANTTLADHSQRIESLENSSGGESSQEEKIELCSYDYMKIVDNTYRDNLWEPMPVYFVAEVGKRVKMHIKFDIINTFTSSTPITLTTTINLDGEDILTDVYEFADVGNHEIDFEHYFIPAKRGHKVVIKAVSSKSANTSKLYTKPDYFTFELYGTNVQFVSRHHDFNIAFNDTENVMTTTCIDQYARLSRQTADENLSFAPENFISHKVATYRDNNLIYPFYNYSIVDKEIVYSDNYGLCFSNYARTSPQKRTAYKNEVTENVSTVISDDGLFAIGSEAYAQTTKHIDSNNDMKFIYVYCGSVVMYQRAPVDFFYQINDGYNYADVSGIIRVNNKVYDDDCFFAIREDGECFFCPQINLLPGEGNIDKVSLGFGTNPNAYVVQDGSIELYLRVGGNVKKIVLRKENEQYVVHSTNIIEGIQEFWYGANGSRFERCGNHIQYYPPNSSSSTTSLKLY